MRLIAVKPRPPPPAMGKCPHCGGTDLEARPDGAYLCRTCYFVSKPVVNPSLLQSWTGSVFNLAQKTPPPDELVTGARFAFVGGLLFLIAVLVAVVPMDLPGSLAAIVRPTPPSEIAFLGGATAVGAIGLVVLFAGYTMKDGDPKAWRAALPAGLIGLVLGILGPGGVLGIVAGGFAALGGYVGRAE